jgi:hypothetical protein
MGSTMDDPAASILLGSLIGLDRKIKAENLLFIRECLNPL